MKALRNKAVSTVFVFVAGSMIGESQAQQDLDLTKVRTPAAPLGTGGALVFNIQDSVNHGNGYPQTAHPVAFLVPDGTPGSTADDAAMMFYSSVPAAGMQLGVGPGTADLSQIQSPHVAAMRVQRVNGANEEAMVWISTNPPPGSPTYSDGTVIAPYKLAVITANSGHLQPFQIVMNGHPLTQYNVDGSIDILASNTGAIITKYYPDGSKEDYWKGFPIMHNEPTYGSIEFETSARFPVMNSIAEVYSNPVLGAAQPGIECNFVDNDGLIKKAIKQNDGRWTRISDNSYL